MATLGRVAPQLIASRLRERFMTPRTSSPRDWELPLLASSERITLRFGLSALRWGSGPTVLLMHGWRAPTQFALLIRGLVDAVERHRWNRSVVGDRVFTLDVPITGNIGDIVLHGGHAEAVHVVCRSRDLQDHPTAHREAETAKAHRG